MTRNKNRIVRVSEYNTCTIYYWTITEYICMDVFNEQCYFSKKNSNKKLQYKTKRNKANTKKSSKQK